MMTAKLLGLVSALGALIAVMVGLMSSHVVPAIPTFGAVPVLTNPIENNEGGKLYAKTIPMTASTSPCVFLTPNATTTVISGPVANFKEPAGTSGQYYDWGVSRVQGATTTILAHKDGNVGGTFNATTSVTNLNIITAYSGGGSIGPNTYISLHSGTSSMSTNLTGVCAVSLMVVKL